MKTRLWLSVIVLLGLLPSRQLSASETAPETLLPADTVFFLKLSPWSELRETAGGTALAKVMRGDMGGFFSSLAAWGRMCAEECLKQSLPDESLRLKQYWGNLDKSWQQVLEHGVLLAVQQPKDGQNPLLLFVFPDGGKNGKSAVQKFLEDGSDEDSGRRSAPETREIAGRTVTIVQFDGSAWAWWSEDGHLVVAALNDSSEELAVRLFSRNVSGQWIGARNLTDNVFYQKLAASRNYATLLSCFADIGSMLAPYIGDDEPNALREAGVYDIQGVTFSCGFEGRAWRESYALHIDPQRRGIWQVLNAAQKVDVEQLPALPADASCVCFGALDTGRLFDLAWKALSDNADGEESDAARALLQGVFKEVVRNLGPQVVWFNSPGEGGFLLDQAVAIQVQDMNALKAQVRLAHAGQKLGQWFGEQSEDWLAGLSLTKRTYRGVEYWTLAVPQGDISLAVSFVIHDGWLVIGGHPQIVQGHILRSRKEAPCWSPSAELRQSLSATVRDEQSILQKSPRNGRIVFASQLDTRELTRAGLSWAPWVSWYMEQGDASLRKAGLPPLDPASIPNVHAVPIKQLFPNVNLLIDDGASLRWEKHASLPLGSVVTAYAGFTGWFVILNGKTDLSVWVPQPKSSAKTAPARPAPLENASRPASPIPLDAPP